MVTSSPSLFRQQPSTKSPRHKRLQGHHPVHSSAHMNNGPARDIPHGLPQHFMCQRSRIPLAEEEKSKNIDDRISFPPAEIDMRYSPRNSSYLNQHRGNRIRHHGASRVQYAMAPNSLAPYRKPLIELRSIRALYL